MNNVLLTAEQAQQIEEISTQAIKTLEYLNSIGIHSDSINPTIRAEKKALAIIRTARAQEPITTPDVCGEVCARAKLCYGCNKDLEEANAKYAEQAEQEPRELAPVLAGFDRSKYTDDQWDWCLEYERITDYEPLMCDFENGTHSFYEAAQASVQWYEDHTSDAHLRISRTVGKFDPENEVDYD